MGRWREAPEGLGKLGRVRTLTHADPLVIADVELRSRLFVGTGKYASDEAMLAALEASDCELVTVALRRLDLDHPKQKTILDVIDWQRYRILPNTAGCRTADEAIRIARLARSMGLSDWVKLEVIPDPRYLFPDPEETLKAARVLVDEGFKVLPYINADPVLARKLEEIGTVKFYAADKGFGFIVRDRGGKDIFVHASALNRAGIAELGEGQRVAVDMVEGGKGPEALNIRLI